MKASLCGVYKASSTFVTSCSPFFLFFKDFIYLFMTDRQTDREAETQAEGEAGSLQGA